MPKTRPYVPALDLLLAKNPTFVDRGIITVKRQVRTLSRSSGSSSDTRHKWTEYTPTVAAAATECASPRLTLLCTNVTLLDCTVAGDGPVGAILGMRHRRVRGDTPRKLRPLSSWNSHLKRGKTVRFGVHFTPRTFFTPSTVSHVY